MEIMINLPEHTLRKVRAFGILSGGGSVDLESVLIDLIDESLSAAIITAVGGNATHLPPIDNYPAAQESGHRPAPVARDRDTFDTHPDASGISGGLGDEDDDGGTSDEMAFVPKNGGVSGSDLEHDMDIDDPEHEAKVDASAVSPSSASSRPEKLFADMADMPEPSAPDPREARRRKPLKSKAKVTGFTGSESSTF